MKVKMNNEVRQIPEGQYQGQIDCVGISVEYATMWLTILVNDSVLNTPISLKSKLINQIAESIVNENGEFDTDDLLKRSITFTVIDRVKNDATVSKITQIEVA